MIYHIYWGTAGNAGLYLDEIYQTLKKQGFEQEVFVSHYFPFEYGHKVFFRFTEMGHGVKLWKFRNIIRFIELIWALVSIYFMILRYKPTVVNYSLIGVFSPVVCFLKMIKKTTNSRLVLTCHDVLPFENGHQSLSKQESMRAQCFQLADYLIVHNQNSINILKDSFNITTDIILMHRFPIMDLKKLFFDDKVYEKKYDFLFIGQLRKEKGIEILLSAWKLFHATKPEAKLCIAGNTPFGFDKSVYNGLNIDFDLQFLSDEQYYNYINISKCIVLPYIDGTNSGVVSTLVTIAPCVITSDLEMFKTNPLLDTSMMFENRNPSSLENIMRKVYKESLFESNITPKVEKYKIGFSKEINAVYSKILE